MSEDHTTTEAAPAEEVAPTMDPQTLHQAGGKTDTSPTGARYLKGFNQWIIGGGYSKNTIRRSHMKIDVAIKRRELEEERARKHHAEGAEVSDEEATPASMDGFQRHVMNRKREIQQQKDHQITTYKAKATAAIRDNVTLGSRRAQRTGAEGDESKRKSPARRSPKRLTDPLGDTAPAGPMEAAKALRARLQMSFAQATAEQSSGSMFPPLLTPYSRPMNFLRGSDQMRSPRQADNGGGLAFQQSEDATENVRGPREAFSLSNASRQRPQPASGPKAFLPTGHTMTAHRHFQNYMLSMKAMQNGMMSGHQQQADANAEMLSGMLSSSKAPQSRRGA